MANFCENPFVYAEMTDVAGAHIDHENHSMFNPAYPTTIYAAQYHIENGLPLEMNGTAQSEPTLKRTSTIMISPNSYDKGRKITVNADVTYTTAEIFAQSNKQTIESWAKAMAAYSPKLIVRFETAWLLSFRHFVRCFIGLFLILISVC